LPLQQGQGEVATKYPFNPRIQALQKLFCSWIDVERGCFMSIEYIASIAEADYKLFRIIITADIPRDYETWLRVRERGKLRVREAAFKISLD
jgi:hypothetical protein